MEDDIWFKFKLESEEISAAYEDHGITTAAPVDGVGYWNLASEDDTELVELITDLNQLQSNLQ